MKDNLKLLIKEIGIIAVCAAAGVLALVITYFVPREYMRDRVYQSSIVLYHEGLGDHIWEQVEETMLDGHTDGLLLNVSYTETGEGLTDILLDTYVEVGGKNPMNSLYEVIALANDDYIVKHYGRYWHGYQVILRPLLCLFTYSDIRHMNMILQLALVFWLISMLVRSENRILVIPFFAMYVFLSPISLFSSLQYSPCFYIMMFAVIAIVRWGKTMSDTRTSFLFLLTGVATAYFDMLTYPFVTLAIPLITYLAIEGRQLEAAGKKYATQIISHTASWGIGYVGMWASKWIIASLLTDENILYDAFKKILSRSGYFTDKHAYSDTLKLNLGVCNIQVLMMAVICLITYIVIYRMDHHIAANKKLLPCIGAILFVSLYPFIWYFFTKDHSCCHSYFTWRELAISVYGIFMIGVLRIKEFHSVSPMTEPMTEA